MQTASTDQRAETGYTILKVKKTTKARLDGIMQELGIQGTEDNKLSLFIDKYEQLTKHATEEPQP